MKFVACTSAVLGFAGVATAQQYGYNHVNVQRDTDIIASAFPDVDIELFSPAFLTPENRLPGFSDGTQGPTSHEDMGMC
jgi:hypothetical protein